MTFYRLLCYFGMHDWKPQPIPKAKDSAVVARRMCKDCFRSQMKVMVAINEARWIDES